MSTNAEKEKAAADKRIADEATASAAAANCPTGGYNMFIPLLIISMFAVLVICVDVSTICLVRSFIIKFQYVITTTFVKFMIYYWINLIEQLPIYSTIQKPNLYRQFAIQGFAALKH